MVIRLRENLNWWANKNNFTCIISIDVDLLYCYTYNLHLIMLLCNNWYFCRITRQKKCLNFDLYWDVEPVTVLWMRTKLVCANEIEFMLSTSNLVSGPGNRLSPRAFGPLQTPSFYGTPPLPFASIFPKSLPAVSEQSHPSLSPLIDDFHFHLD